MRAMTVEETNQVCKLLIRTLEMGKLWTLAGPTDAALSILETNQLGHSPRGVALRIVFEIHAIGTKGNVGVVSAGSMLQAWADMDLTFKAMLMDWAGGFLPTDQLIAKHERRLANAGR